MASPASMTTLVDDETSTDLWGHIIHGFVATNRRLHEGVKSTFDLNEAETETLLTLFRNAELRVPMVALAHAAAFTSGGFTKIADKLTGRGLIVRVACAEDRRVTYLELTPTGVELTQRLARHVSQFIRAQFVAVLGQDRAVLVADAFVELYDANRTTAG